MTRRNADKYYNGKVTTTLSDRDRDLFLAMLDSDAEPNEAMKQAAARYKELRVDAAGD